MASQSSLTVMDNEAYTAATIGFTVALLPLTRNFFNYPAGTSPNVVPLYITILWFITLALVITTIVMANKGKWDLATSRKAIVMFMWALISGALGLTLGGLGDTYSLHPTSLLSAALVASTATILLIQ